MAFTSLRAILDKKGTEHPALREASVLRDIQRVWKRSGLAFFPKSAQRGIRASAKVRSFRRKVVEIDVGESAVAAALHFKKREILALFRRECPDLDIDDIIFRIGGQ